MRAMSRDQVRDVDRRALEQFRMPSLLLMENAGRGAAQRLEQLGVSGQVVICAGKGNNGGDGFVIARHLENHGHNVRVLLFSSPDGLEGDALTNYRILEAACTPLAVISPDVQNTVPRVLAEADWIVDALLGTGTRGQVREPFSTAIRQINESGRKVLAVDLPSGLDCDTGEPLGCCVRADHTVTFVARKIGFDRPGAADLVGAVHVVDIGVPRAALAGPHAGP